MDRLTAAEVFIAIAGRSSLSAAADALGMSRTMVSRYLADMERWAGVRLLNRTTRSISLTSGGAQALQRCKDMVSLAANIPQFPPRGGQLLQGPIRMSCSHSLGQATLAAAISAFHHEFPKVLVELVVDNRALHLVDDRVDLAVRIHHGLEGSLVARTLGQCASVLCASPNYLKRRGVPQVPADLIHHDCAVYSPLGLSSWKLRPRQGAHFLEVPVKGYISANDSLFLLASALSDSAITVQPYLSVMRHLAEGRLIRVLPDFEPPALEVGAIYASRSHLAPQIRAMLDHLARWFDRADVKWMLLGPHERPGNITAGMAGP